MRATFIWRTGSGACRTLDLHGREAWALVELVRAGAAGCTPVMNPGPRWSGYVHRLRHRYGLQIETIHEAHQGAFPGRHARYQVRSNVSILQIDQEAA